MLLSFKQEKYKKIDIPFISLNIRNKVTLPILYKCVYYIFLMRMFFARIGNFFHSLVITFLLILLPSIEHAGLITKPFTARFNSEFEWGGNLLESSTCQGCYDIQHNDIQHDDIQHNDIQHNNKKCRTQHNDIQRNN